MTLNETLYDELKEAITVDDHDRIKGLLDDHPGIANYVVRKYDELPLTYLPFTSPTMSVKTASLLLEAGADIHRRGHSNYTPLLCAFSYSKDLAQFYMSRGANVKDRTNFGFSILTCAIHHPPNIDLALDILGIDQIDQCIYEGKTAFLLAVKEEKIDAIDHLLSRGANAIATSWNNENAISMMRHHAEPSLALLQKLIDLGIDPTLVSYDGHSALLGFAKSGFEEGVLLLLKHGADPNSYNAGEYTALTQAIFNEQQHLCEKLIEAGATLNLPQENNEPILNLLKSMSISSDKKERIQALCEYLEHYQEACELKKMTLLRKNEQGVDLPEHTTKVRNAL